MNETLWDAIEALVSAINKRNRTDNHSKRVSDYAVKIAEAAGWQGEVIAELRLGALFHDVGHILFSGELIQKQTTALNEEDKTMIMEHTSKGVGLIEKWESLKFLTPYILYHQEWIDGSGYPFGLKGAAIPEEVQILSIADVYEALRQPRLYKNRLGLPHYESIKIMEDMKGKRWDANLFDVFVEASESWD